MHDKMGYGTVARITLDVPILNGLPSDDITQGDIEAALAAALSLLHNTHAPRTHYRPFDVVSVTVNGLQVEVQS